MTFENLNKVNEKIKKIEVKGKAYACVFARVQAFRELYPNGKIETELQSLNEGTVIIKASVFDDNNNLLATGLACEKESSSFINKTSFIENCETSAVGRALGFVGIGSDEGLATAEEMVNALNNQNKKSNEKCAVCGSQIQDTPTKTGETWTCENIIGYSKKKFGLIACPECMKKLQKEQEQKELADES